MNFVENPKGAHTRVHQRTTLYSLCIAAKVGNRYILQDNSVWEQLDVSTWSVYTTREYAAGCSHDTTCVGVSKTTTFS